MSLLDDSPRSATVIATEPLEVVTICGMTSCRFFRKTSSIARKVLAELSRRLRNASNRIESLRTMDVYGRLARFFLDLAAENGKPLDNGYVAVTRPTHQSHREHDRHFARDGFPPHPRSDCGRICCSRKERRSTSARARSINSAPSCDPHIPNGLTLLRVLLIPVFLFASFRGMFLTALILFCHGSGDRHLRRLIARRLNQRSRLGAILDPAADKIMLVFGYLYYTLASNLPAVRIPGWLTFVVFIATF